MKKITERINKRIQKLLDQYRSAEGKTYEKMYRLYGSIEDAEYTDDHTLEIYFVSKAYGNEGGYSGTIKLLTMPSMRKRDPKSSTTPLGISMSGLGLPMSSQPIHLHDSLASVVAR